ncbi:MAG TPA: YceI family protein [Candidatus Dormibacteraeota bacterium]|jgi:polyisoprenoid-binding protein YceI
MHRGWILGAVALLLLGAVGGLTAILLGTHRAPAPLALGSPAVSAAATSLAGTWKVTSGSEAGYRVREQFINQPAPTEAVARTSKVTGGLKVLDSGPGLAVTDIHVAVELASLQSQDRYATYQVYQRDFFIRTIYLQTDQYSTADFTASVFNLPQGLGSDAVSVAVAGKLNLHGITKSVITQLQAQRSGTGVEIVGSISVDMRDFGIEVPSISFTKAEPAAVIEYKLALIRA